MKKIILFIVSALVRLNVLTPIRVARLKFFYKTHRRPNFEHPKDINEKINWLKFYGDTSLWTTLADKYAVRSYIKGLGLEELLVPLVGKWDSADDIEWDSLPNQFVMKGNARSGDIVVCKNKADLDRAKTIGYFNKVSKVPYGLLTGEPHYKNIKPCVIVERLLDSSSQPCNSTSLVDYKIWCFDGEPKYVICYYNRDHYYADIAIFDCEWNYHPEWMLYSDHYKKPKKLISKPEVLEEMLSVARKMTKGLPEVRLDLYEVDGKVFFGEYTFTSSGGFMAHFTQDFLNILGGFTKLPID